MGLRSGAALRIQRSAEGAYLNYGSASSVGSRLRAHKTETRSEIVGSLTHSPRCPVCVVGSEINAGARRSDNTGATSVDQTDARWRTTRHSMN
jgi:hypothetical protein